MFYTEIRILRVLRRYGNAVIPATLNGKYVIGLTAYDEAGNIGNYATYIITVDLASMRVTLEPLDIYATLNN